MTIVERRRRPGMTAADRRRSRPAPSDERLARLSDTSRVETFSDGVFAIIITLLVLDLRVPAVAPGDLLTGLLRQWPAYVAYVTSFLYVGILWQNHHAVFHRIRYIDRGAHWANLGVLFTAALLPFPTAVVSYAIQDGNAVTHERQRRSTRSSERSSVAAGFDRERTRALIGVVGYLAAGVAGLVLTPYVSLVVFFALPAFYGVTSQGLSELHDVLQRRPFRRRGDAEPTDDEIDESAPGE